MANRKIEIPGFLRFLMIERPATAYKINAKILGRRNANSELPNNYQKLSSGTYLTIDC